jgi:hypothetical protein
MQLPILSSACNEWQCIWDLLLPFECSDLVRLGPRSDGGYIHSLQTIKDSNALLSFGIDRNWDFEKDFQVVSNCKTIHAYDNSVDRSTFASGVRKHALRILEKPFRLKPYNATSDLFRSLAIWADFRSTFSGRNHFFRLTISKSSGRGLATVQECLKRLDYVKGPIFLKCDIEGSEYDIVDDLILSASRLSVSPVSAYGTDLRLCIKEDLGFVVVTKERK